MVYQTHCWHVPPEMVLLPSIPPSSAVEGKNEPSKQHDEEEFHRIMFQSPRGNLKSLVAPQCEPPSPILTPNSLSRSTSASSDVVSLDRLPASHCMDTIRKRSNSCGGNNKRRSIFGSQVWNQTPPSQATRNTDSERSIQSHPTLPISLQSREGGNSPDGEFNCPPRTSAVDRAEKEKYDHIRRMLRAPANRRLDRPHFRADVDLLPTEDSCSATSVLPDLPYPMRRFCQEGARTKLKGVYPLVSPAPILRASSYGQRQNTAQEPRQKESQSCAPESSLLASMVNEFNMNDTVRIRKDQTCALQGWKRMETSNASSSSSDREEDELSKNEEGDAQAPRTPEHKKVHFDPRVTVTEFEDSLPRYWFSAFELERLQRESVHLVQKYLIAHPSLIVDYNEARLDPITGKYRKRALFTIPILRAHSTEEEEAMLLASCGKQRTACAESMAKSQVQNILVAARNRLVADLLSRSLKTIFPHAAVKAVTTGEEALRIYTYRASCSENKNKRPSVLQREQE